MVKRNLKIEHPKSTPAFTIVELLVAMTIMTILTALASVIFAAALKAFRIADATMEITRRADAICTQLTQDFTRLQKDAPLAIWFEVDTATGNRYDQIQFFANGNFQTIKQYLYDSNGNGVLDAADNVKTVTGNVSRIHYGHAWQADMATATPQRTYRLNEPSYSTLSPSGLLSRRAHLQTADTTLNPFPDLTTFNTTFIPSGNNAFEYETLSLTDWQTLVQTQAYDDRILQTCFNNTGTFDPVTMTTGRPVIDMKNINTLHLLLSEQVSNFQVQGAYTSSDLVMGSFSDIRWWPNYDSDDFGTLGGGSAGEIQFGVYFNMPGGTTFTDWYLVSARKAASVDFLPTYFPKALKFTFTLHDSKGQFPNGRTFTHIVMIDN